MTRIWPLPQPLEGEVGGVGLVGGEVGARVGDVVTGLTVGCLLGESVTGFNEGLVDGASEGLEEGARVGDDVLGLDDDSVRQLSELLPEVHSHPSSLEAIQGPAHPFVTSRVGLDFFVTVKLHPLGVRVEFTESTSLASGARSSCQLGMSVKEHVDTSSMITCIPALSAH